VSSPTPRPARCSRINESGVSAGLRPRRNASRNSDKSQIRKIHRYQVDLRYAYQVGKRDFVGTTANWGWTAIYGLRELAEKAAGQYTNGQPVTVYYDPEQPGKAVLEPDGRQASIAPLIFGAISAVAGSAILAHFIKVGFDHWGFDASAQTVEPRFVQRMRKAC
jgi:hypothetical protein